MVRRLGLMVISAMVGRESIDSNLGSKNHTVQLPQQLQDTEYSSRIPIIRKYSILVVVNTNTACSVDIGHVSHMTALPDAPKPPRSPKLHHQQVRLPCLYPRILPHLQSYRQHVFLESCWLDVCLFPLVPDIPGSRGRFSGLMDDVSYG